MAFAPLLNVPTEVLDRVYSFLDWDRTESLYPKRPDIINISLTCRHLRNAVLPLIFQNVVLRLRWVDGALIEPALYRLRKDQPNLARHVRSVYIHTEFGPKIDPEFKLPGFAVPDALSDWVNPASMPDDPRYAVERLHRQRVANVSEQLFKEFETSLGKDACTPELSARIKSFRQHIFGHQDTRAASSLGDPNYDAPSRPSRELLGESSRVNATHGELNTITPASRDERRKVFATRLQIDALVVVMLCLPATVNELTYQAYSRGRMDARRNGFSLHVLGVALQVFGNRLRRLSVMTSPPQAVALTGQVAHRGELDVENEIVTADVLQGMEKLTTLVLSDYEGANSRRRSLTTEHQVTWPSLTDSITRLELWNLGCEPQEIFSFVTRFERLHSLAFQNVRLVEGPNLHWQHNTVNDCCIWLKLLIRLRRHSSNVDLRLVQLRWCQELSPLPQSAIQWLSQEAIPMGCDIGFDRETRLIEDFESFLGNLWDAEDGERGEQARDSRKDGRLVDAALTSRWKTFANQR